jgi:hypothetical protein
MRKVSRERARAVGLEFYFTAEPCLEGHVAERRISDGRCIACHPPRSRIISGPDAEERGLTRYFTGEPCTHGHYADRYVRSGACVECLRQRKAARGRRRRRPIADAWRRFNPWYFSWAVPRARSPKSKEARRGIGLFAPKAVPPKEGTTGHDRHATGLRV